MKKYYVLKESFTVSQWTDYLVEKIHESGDRIEIIESFTNSSELTSRKLASERMLNPPAHFIGLKPDFITVTMRPFFIKEDNFCFVYSYKLNESIINQLKHEWTARFIEEGLMPEYFVIYSDDRPEFLYSHNNLETVLLIRGNEKEGELFFAKSIGLNLEELKININDLAI